MCLHQGAHSETAFCPHQRDMKIVSGMWFLTSVLIQLKGGPLHHPSSDHYYSPPRGPKEDRNWSPHMDSYELMVGASFVASQIINIFFLDLWTNFWIKMCSSKHKRSCLFVFFINYTHFFCCSAVSIVVLRNQRAITRKSTLKSTPSQVCSLIWTATRKTPAHK